LSGSEGDRGGLLPGYGGSAPSDGASVADPWHFVVDPDPRLWLMDLDPDPGSGS
jgi:hypothetical protein